VQRVFRDEKFIHALILKLLEFRAHIENRNPPPPDWSEACAAALFRMHPDDNGLAVGLPDVGKQIVNEIKQIKEQVKALEKAQRHRENILKAALGPHTFGMFSDGTGLSWRTSERSEHTVAASKYRRLQLECKVPKGTRITETLPNLPLLEVNTDGETGSDGGPEEH